MAFTVCVHHNTGDYRGQYPAGTRLSDILADAGLVAPHPCGGHGKCGKCAVRVVGEVSPMSETEREALRGARYPTDGSYRLSCQAEINGNLSIYYNTTDASLQGVVQGFCKEFSIDPPSLDGGIGMAVDIGTTTVAAYLYDLTTGRLLTSACVENPQKMHGADVISRVGHALSGGGEQLKQEIEDCLGALARELSQRAGVQAPGTVVIVGNTAMLHLLTGTDVSLLAAAPFILKRSFGEWEGRRYYPPCISAYVGADMTAAILASGMCERPDQTSLLIDVGTNGEMALFHGGELSTCSTAAGPAFEGAGISCGSLAVPGAVSDVKAVDGRIVCETIQGLPAVGLCGTGLIDAAAVLLELGLMEDSGYMAEDAVLGESGLVLTRADIRQLQLAKAAIRAGIETLLSDRGLTCDNVDVLYLAGGFGSYLHPESCAAIGMIPRELIGKIAVLGNAAGQGASMMLLSREELAHAEKIARSATTLELSSSAMFMEKYVDGMLFGD